MTATPRPRWLLYAALAAARQGWHVFPVQPRGKIPAVRRWEDVATIDSATIIAWWQARPYNIGIATGPSRLLVVDLDTARGATPPPRWAGAGGGQDVLRGLAADAGQPFPDHTHTVATPTGGLHLYFRQPDDAALRNTTGRLGWKIDTRGHGGYVIGAGSIRPTGRYHAVSDHPIALLPAWLAVALTPPPRSATETAAAGPPRDAGAYLRAILTAETAAVVRARPGNRHTTLLAAAVTLGRLVAGGELAEHDARAALRHAADIHIGIANMTADEVGATINDGLRYGARRPRYLNSTSTASGTSGGSASWAAALPGNAKGPHTGPPCAHVGP